jgi:hypothetical protein
MSRFGDFFPRSQPPCHQIVIGLRCEMLPPIAVKVTKSDFHAIDTPLDQVVDRLSALVA